MGVKIIQHATIGCILALPVSAWSFSGALGFIAASILVDVDHFIFYSFQTRRLPWPGLEMESAYQRWSYYGPRVLVLHNYEALLFSGIVAAAFGGFSAYVFAGFLLHLLLDQVSGYALFRYLRVKTLTGDVLRYLRYLEASRSGREREYMLARRDSWQNHLCSLIPDRAKLESVLGTCGILSLFPDVPIDPAQKSAEWRALL